jgi:hypothetical protein
MKKFLYVILGLVVLFFTIRLATCKEKFQDNKELINKLDSINKATILLQEEQQRLAEHDSVFNENIVNIDSKIGAVQEKKTIIKEYYHDQSTKVKHFTPTQTDSFFKSRYNY